VRRRARSLRKQPRPAHLTYPPIRAAMAGTPTCRFAGHLGAMTCGRRYVRMRTACSQSSTGCAPNPGDVRARASSPLGVADNSLHPVGTPRFAAQGSETGRPCIGPTVSAGRTRRRSGPAGCRS
jgi:hypothetical protein